MEHHLHAPPGSECCFRYFVLQVANGLDRQFLPIAAGSLPASLRNVRRFRQSVLWTKMPTDKTFPSLPLIHF